jgi:hypothetical protein
MFFLECFHRDTALEAVEGATQGLVGRFVLWRPVGLF